MLIKFNIKECKRMSHKMNVKQDLLEGPERTLFYQDHVFCTNQFTIYIQ